MQKICNNCGQNFEISKDDLDFLEKISPKIKNKVYKISPPTFCPDCRMQRKMSFRNERFLYTRKCDLCEKPSILLYSPDKKYTVYCRSCWWKDSFDPLDFGQEYNFEQSFFEQFDQLLYKVPLLGLWNLHSENADFNNNSFYLKNSYLNFNSDKSERIFYNYGVENGIDIFDCTFVHDSELCYECIDCEKIYYCLFSQNLKNSNECYFSSDLIGCSRCFACHGLRNKDLYIFNQKVTLEQFHSEVKNLVFTHDLINEFKAKSREVYLKIPKRFAQIFNCENAIGDQIRNCKNVINCFDCKDAENVKNVIYGAFDNENILDSYGIGDVKWGYEILGSGFDMHTNAFIINGGNGPSDSYYCIQCGQNSKNLFGCIGLRHKQYCVLNKQYNKEEYEKLVPKIIESMLRSTSYAGQVNQNGAVPHEALAEWGEFFPSSMSPFAYNETVAMEEYPLSQEEILKKGYKWQEEKIEIPKVAKIIPADKLPDKIVDIPNDILNWAILPVDMPCQGIFTNRPFIIQKPELDFYRQMNLPIPHLHPDERYKKRMELRNPRRLWERKCDKCGEAILTTYSPDRKEIIYCEDCYLQEVY
ncbi:hypothetical protein A2335_04055 [Candidatus Peregrinibacteria bacterium RIFOXYB2_FULL_32_7]|nr:MAG: hypothetical protein A2335_04055 [Candidatus Peregrinibacteria bacterium RIFOXYB2_FULL_32_7]